MDRNALIWILGAGGIYLWLRSRQPVMTAQGVPASFIDQLTLAVNPTAIPVQAPSVVPPPSYSINIPGVINAQYTQ